MVARAIGCSQATVHSFAKKNNELIQKAAQELIDMGLDNAVKATINDVQHSVDVSKIQPRQLTPEDRDYQKSIGLKARDNLLKMTGILPTHAPSQVVQNITNIQQNNHISPVIQQFLSAIGSQFTDPDVVDVPRATTVDDSPDSEVNKDTA